MDSNIPMHDLNGRRGPLGSSNAEDVQAIPPSWLRLFSAPEVNQLLAGGRGGTIDVADMRAHTQYSGGYTANSDTVRLFWKVAPQLLFALVPQALHSTASGPSQLGCHAFTPLPTCPLQAGLSFILLLDAQVQLCQDLET